MSTNGGKCEGCPRKDVASLQRSIATLHRSLGSEDLAKECEARALEIDQSSCPWWWGVKEENKTTGQIRHSFVCGAQAMVGFMVDQGARVEEALQTAQSSRNDAAIGLNSIVQALSLIPSASTVKILQPNLLPSIDTGMSRVPDR